MNAFSKNFDFSFNQILIRCKGSTSGGAVIKGLNRGSQAPDLDVEWSISYHKVIQKDDLSQVIKLSSRYVLYIHNKFIAG